MASDESIFLAGASRGVGWEIARQLRDRHYPVTALLRSNQAQPQLEGLGVQVVLGDALDAAAVEQAVLASSPTTVISTIGGPPSDTSPRADFLGNKHLIDAAVKAGAQRFILISSIGSGDSVVALPPHILEALRPALIDKDKAEQHLIASGLSYTIIRPGGLKSDPATGTAVLTPDPTIAGSIHRADVAHLVCQCLASTKAENRVLSAVDRQQTYSQTEFEVLDVS